jgi:tetratricopeptide (TPR) repeat protein
MIGQGSTRLFAAILCGLVLACSLVAPPAAALAAQSSFHREQRQNTRIHDLRKDVNENEKIITFLLFPVTVLVGILSLGGAIGVVFSIRDQRRVSQLHELSVAGEMSSQRRTEQSYSTFFEQSQTTLSLVNETLQLAKDATDQAAKSMDDKAKLRIDAIEEKAQKLMLGLSHEFDAVVFDQETRHELEDIAKELSTLEGYLSLQKIKLGHYTQFVKAIDRFLNDETEAALAELQLASQDPIVGDLQKFIEYWIGYILTTVGQYSEAIEQFKHDELSIPENSSQYVQLERIIIETEFFLIAKEKPKAARGAKSETERDEESKVVDSRSPKVRFEDVASLLDRLSALSRKLEGSSAKEEEKHTRMEVARTRADIYEWVAYDPGHLDDPIEQSTVDEARLIIASHGEEESPAEPASAQEVPEGPAAEKKEPEEARGFVESPLWQALATDDLFRCWALREAQDLCSNWEDASADIAFALAECHFKLRDERAVEEFRNADEELHQEMVEHRELRHEASHLQCLLICHCRLLKLQKLEEQKKEEEKEERGRENTEEVAGDREEEEKATTDVQQEDRLIRSTQREILKVLKRLGRGRVTIFSQIQRRNLTQEEFRDEVSEIAAGMGIRDKQGASGELGDNDAPQGP